MFAYALLSFWNEKAPTSKSLRFEDIAFGSGSPGQVFKLTENAIVDRLYVLSSLTHGAMRYDDTAGLRQVLVERKSDAISLLQSHYGVKGKEGRRATK